MTHQWVVKLDIHDKTVLVLVIVFTDICYCEIAQSVNSPHKGPATRKMFPFDDVIM